MRLVWVVGFLVGCGRLDFDALSDGQGGSGTPRGDARGVGDSSIGGDGGAGTPIRYAQAVGGGTSGTTTISAPLPNVIVGDLLIVEIDFEMAATATLIAFTDTAGDGFTTFGPNDEMTNRQYLGYALLQASGNTTVTAKLSANAGSYYDIRVLEYKNVSQTSPVDTSSHVSGTSTGTNETLATTITSGSQELLVAVVTFVGGNGTPGSGWISVNNFNTGIVEDLAAPTAGSYAITANDLTATQWAVDALALDPP